MGERMVVHSVATDAEPDAEVFQRLHVSGIEIIEQQPHMLLVAGDRQAITRALGDAHGWSISALTTVPPPRTRERLLKRPSR